MKTLHFHNLGGWDYDSSSKIQNDFNKILNLSRDNMWNSGSWNDGFSSNIWSSKSPKSWNGQWNSFYGLGNIGEEINDIVNEAINEANKITEEANKLAEEAKRKAEQAIPKIIKGRVIFNYTVDKNRTFRDNWNNRVEEIKKHFGYLGFDVIIDTDEAEYDSYSNVVKAQIDFVTKSRFDVDNIFTHLSIIRNQLYATHGIEFLIVYKRNDRGAYEKIYNKEDFKKNDKVKETPTEAPTKAPVEVKKEEPKEPKIVKVIDETKKRFRKRTFEIVKKITEIDEIPVNCLIVKQVRGDKDRKRYTLNQNDCELLGIEYKDNLEILPGDLEYENVYKKVKK